MTREQVHAYHFTGAVLRDGRAIPAIGEWLEHAGQLELCESGLHASERLLDALLYAPGLTLHVVTLDGDVQCGSDKLAAQRRRIESSREVPFRAVVRLAIESACLAAWCAGMYLPELITALEACDREDWEAAARAARSASTAAWSAKPRAVAGAAGGAAGAAGASGSAWAAGAAVWAADAADRAADAAWSAGAAWSAAGAAARAATRAALEARAQELCEVSL